jgi:hypothetical protein
MKKFRELSEAIKDKYDEGEYDQEGDMAKSDLRSIMANAKELHDMIDDADNLPEWCQNKITLAEDYISTVANYLTAEMNEEVELDEAFPKSTQYALVHSSSKKIVAKGNKKEMTKKVKELNAKEKGSHYVGISYGSKVGDTFGEEVELDEIAVVKINKPIGTRVADIGSGGKEFNVKTNKAYDDAKKKKPQGAFFATQRRKERLASSGRMDEEIETLEEKNKPTNPELWSRAISLAKSKFDVYPSAYANGWASKWYKSKGGGWRTVSEAKDDNLPFKPDEPKKKSVVVGKKPEGYSIARQLARQAMQSQIEKLKKPVKEAEEKDLPFKSQTKTKQEVIPGKYGAGYSMARHLARQAMQKQIEKMQKKPMKEESNKAKIVKDMMKKKKDSSEDAFQNEPELSSTLTKGF